MEIEVEFKWPLNQGVTIVVTADGHYRDGSIGFPQLGFITNNGSDSYTSKVFEGIQKEWAQIEDHAVILMCEKAREQLKEVEYS